MSSKLIRKRGYVRGKVTKYSKTLAEELQKSVQEIDVSQLAVVKDCLSQLQGQLKEYDDQICDALESELTKEAAETAIDKDMTTSIELYFTITEKISLINTKINEVKESKKPAPESGQQPMSDYLTLTKMPEISIEKFDGNPMKWLTFWDRFNSAVHSNPRVKDVEKFNHLKGLLTGEAARAIDGIPQTSQNYPIVIKTLKDRFGSEQVIIFAHIEALLQISPVTTNDVEKLRTLYDTCEKHFRCLNTFGITEDKYGVFMVPLYLTRLPADVRLIITRIHGNKPWCFDELRKLFEEEIQVREISDISGKSDLKGQSQQTSSSAKGTNNGRGGRGGSGACLMANSNQRQPRQAARSSSYPFCVYCGNKHYSDSCTAITSVYTRKNRLKQLQLCFKCLKRMNDNHVCLTRKPCYHCRNMNHHSSICPNRMINEQSSSSAMNLNANAPPFPFSQQSEQKPSMQQAAPGPPMSLQRPAAATPAMPVFEQPQPPQQVSVKPTIGTPPVVGMLSVGQSVFMPTAPVNVKWNKNAATTRVLFDTGSQRSFASLDLVKRLGINPAKLDRETITIGTFGARNFGMDSPVVNLDVMPRQGMTSLDEQQINCRCNVVPQIQSIHRDPMPKETYASLDRYQLADPPPVDNADKVTIDLLIGGDYFNEFILGSRQPVVTGLFVLESKMGWILTGSVKDDQTTPMSEVSINCNLSLLSMSDDNFALERFWSLESIGIVPEDEVTSLDDESAKEQFDRTIQFMNQRYEVTLPWKYQDPELPLNYALCVGRLRSLIKRISKNPDLMSQYNEILQNQLAQGIIEAVDDDAISLGVQHYIPHHCVVKQEPAATTKMRVVYDCSSKANRSLKSLNECLYRGPVLLEDLSVLLIRFRLHRYGLIADIEKAFLMVGLQVQDRDATRFLWVKDVAKPPTDENIRIFRFRRVLFGMICSPYLLAGTLNWHLNFYETEIAQMLLQDLYVDNVISGANSLDACVEFFETAKRYFADASMNLRQWTSNCPRFREAIPESDRIASDSQVKVLGLNWEPATDNLRIAEVDLSPNPNDDEMTKRQFLQTISKVFDPLGLVAPLTVTGKLLIQQLWREDLDWDEKIPTEFNKKCRSVLSDLMKVSKIAISRFVGNKIVEIHCFVDASNAAYAAAVFFKSSLGETNLIFCKTRVTPIKNSLTLPKKELLAAVIGVRCINFIKKIVNTADTRIVLWSDSQIVLHWIKSSKEPPNVFVANRVKEIRNNEIEFRYVPSRDNPSDIPSRGATFEELSNNQLWWHGPIWLRDSEDNWPATPAVLKTDQLPVEATKQNPHQGQPVDVTTVVESTDISLLSRMKLENFSSVWKLFRTTAWVNRFVTNLLNKKRDDSKRKLDYLSVDELARAKRQWELYVQATSFPDLFNSTRKNQLVDQLGLKIDDDGLIRAYGRLQNTDLKAPVLLPKYHYFSTLLIQDFHINLIHAGMRQTLAKLRENYWIPAARGQIQRVLKDCSTCRRWQGGHYKLPDMASLPWFRTKQDDPPFTYTGVDYFGPLFIKDGDNNQRKVWIALFTCAVVRAVHLEIVDDQSADQFMMCLRRFCSRRGQPKMLISDNASQFKLVHSTLDQLTKIQESCAAKGIEWKFIVELAPWMGGMYERLVGLVKRPLKKALGRSTLNLIQLSTVLCEIEHVINGRPLTYAGGSDVDERHVLTPNHFVCANLRSGFPEPIEETDPEFTVQRLSKQREELLGKMKARKAIIDAYWKIWKNEYLVGLREYHRCKFPSQRGCDTMIQVGDVVLIKDKTPRGQWRVGKVCELLKGTDGQCRAAWVQTSKGKFRRPIAMLFPFESCPPGVSEQV